MAAIGASAGATWSQFLAVTRNMPQFEGTGAHREESSSVDCAISYYGRSDMRRAYEGSRNAATALPPLLGGDRMNAIEQHYRGSPLNWITPRLRARFWRSTARATAMCPSSNPSGWWSACAAWAWKRNSRRSPRARTDSKAPGRRRAFAALYRFPESQTETEVAGDAPADGDRPWPRRRDSGHCLAVRPRSLAQAEPSRDGSFGAAERPRALCRGSEGRGDRDRCRTESGLAVQDQQRRA